jgi:predicted amidohydrolase
MIFLLWLLAASSGEPGEWTHRWSAWTPPGGSSMRLDVIPPRRPAALRIRASQAPGLGYWRSVAGGIEPGREYLFRAPYRSTGVRGEHHRVFAVLSWCADAQGRRPLQRDYARREPDGAGGFHLQRRLTAPAGTASLRIELGLRGAGGGTVLFFEPRLESRGSGATMTVRVAVGHGHPDPAASAEGRLAELGAWLDRAGSARADLIVLPETIFDYNVSGALIPRTRELAAPAQRLLAEKSRQHRAYIVAGGRDVEGGALYNVAWLYDRQGRLAGRYRKVHLPLSEMEAGVAAGTEYPVFATDFGSLGLLICWDLWFPEAARILRLRGAQLLAAPLAGDVSPRHWDIIPRARAIDNAIPLAAAAAESGTASRIVDANGELLAEAAVPGALAVADVPLESADRLRWLSVGDALGDPASLFVEERRPETYGALAADPARLRPNGTKPPSSVNSLPSPRPKAGERPAGSAIPAVPPPRTPRTPPPPTAPPR